MRRGQLCETFIGEIVAVFRLCFGLFASFVFISFLNTTLFGLLSRSHQRVLLSIWFSALASHTSCHLLNHSLLSSFFRYPLWDVPTALHVLATGSYRLLPKRIEVSVQVSQSVTFSNTWPFSDGTVSEALSLLL